MKLYTYIFTFHVGGWVSVCTNLGYTWMTILKTMGGGGGFWLGPKTRVLRCECWCGIDNGPSKAPSLRGLRAWPLTFFQFVFSFFPFLFLLCFKPSFFFWVPTCKGILHLANKGAESARNCRSYKNNNGTLWQPSVVVARKRSRENRWEERRRRARPKTEDRRAQSGGEREQESYECNQIRVTIVHALQGYVLKVGSVDRE